jgi:hypothetical protein
MPVLTNARPEAPNLSGQIRDPPEHAHPRPVNPEAGDSGCTIGPPNLHRGGPQGALAPKRSNCFEIALRHYRQMGTNSVWGVSFHPSGKALRRFAFELGRDAFAMQRGDETSVELRFVGACQGDRRGPYDVTLLPDEMSKSPKGQMDV